VNLFFFILNIEIIYDVYHVEVFGTTNVGSSCNENWWSQRLNTEDYTFITLRVVWRNSECSSDLITLSKKIWWLHFHDTFFILLTESWVRCITVLRITPQSGRGLVCNFICFLFTLSTDNGIDKNSDNVTVGIVITVIGTSM